MGHHKSKRKTTHPPVKGQDFQERNRNEKIALVEIAMDIGSQSIIDLMTCVLHDPDIMGSHVFGRGRIDKIIRAIAERDKYYSNAYNDSKEADKLQEEMDTELRAVYGDDFQPFKVRYPRIVMPGYDEPRKGWK